MTLQQYANAKVRAGKLPNITIEPGLGGVYWLHSDYEDGVREVFGYAVGISAAETARRRAIDKAVKRYA